MKKISHFTSLAMFGAFFLLSGSFTAQAQHKSPDVGASFSAKTTGTEAALKAKFAEHRNQMRKIPEFEQKMEDYMSSGFQSNLDAKIYNRFKINQTAMELPGVALVDCPDGDVFLANQDDVDAFGALGCTEVTGDLIINDSGNSPKITDLTPLSSLTTVAGIFRVTASQLSSLAGLSNLNTVGYLHIVGCNALTNLIGLSGLTQCTGLVNNDNPCSCAAEQNVILYNASLINFVGLSNLSSVNSGLFIHNNNALHNANGLSGLTYIGGALAFQDNPSLQNVSAMSSLTTVVRDLVFRRCQALKNFNGLQNLTSVGAWAIADDMDMLKNFEGLSGLSYIGGRLWVINNNALKNLEGLSSLSSLGEIWLENNASLMTTAGMSNQVQSVGALWILNCPALKNLEGFSGIQSVGSHLVLLENNSLQNVDGLSSLTHLGGDLFVVVNPSLKNINGLSSLTTVSGRIVLAVLPSLQNVNSLSSLTTVGGDIILDDNASLQNVDGLSNVTSVVGLMILQGLPALQNIDGLSGLTWVGALMGMAACPLITNIDALSNLTQVDGVLGMIFMDGLQNLDGLSNVTSAGELWIFENPSLTSCCGIYQLLCADPPACTAPAVGGPIDIFNNGSGCTQADIIAGGPCAPPSAPGLQSPFNTTIDASTGGEGFSVYPNPAKDELVIRLNELITGPAQVKITNSLGQTLWQEQITEAGAVFTRTIRLDAIPSVKPGLYFVTILHNGEVHSRQVVVR